MTKLRTKQITELVEKGLSKNEIAKQLGISPGSVTYWCNKLGIEPKRK